MDQQPRSERSERPTVPRETSTPPSARPQTTKQSIWTPRLIAWTVLLLILLIFALQNLERTELRILFWVIDVQLVWIVLAAALLGYALGWIRPHFRRRR